MHSSHRTRALLGIVLGVIVAIVAVNVIAARPWNTAASASCSDLAERHLRAQFTYLDAGADSQSDLGAERDTTFAELGIVCGWEDAQAADMAAYVEILDAGKALPAVE